MTRTLRFRRCHRCGYAVPIGNFHSCPTSATQIESGGAADREAVGPGGASANAATEALDTSRPALVPGVDLTPMPCPYCDYVHQPTKTGFGLTMHVVREHPEHVEMVPFQQAFDEAIAKHDAATPTPYLEGD